MTQKPLNAIKVRYNECLFMTVFLSRFYRINVHFAPVYRPVLKRVKFYWPDLRGASTMSEDLAVTHFREYLRIKTVQPNPDYGKLCGNFGLLCVSSDFILCFCKDVLWYHKVIYGLDFLNTFILLVFFPPLALTLIAFGHAFQMEQEFFYKNRPNLWGCHAGS